MSSSNYLKPDLLDTSKLSSTADVTAVELGATGGTSTTTGAVLAGLATYVVAARTKFNSADVEHVLVNLQVVADAIARLHL